MGNKGSRHDKVETLPERRTGPGIPRTICHEANEAILARTRHIPGRNNSNVITRSGTERNQTRSRRSKVSHPILEPIPTAALQNTLRTSNRSVPGKKPSLRQNNQLVPVSADINHLPDGHGASIASSAIATRVKRSNLRKVAEMSTIDQSKEVSKHISALGTSYSTYSREPAEKEDGDVKNGPPEVDSNDCECCVNRSDAVTKPLKNYKQLEKNSESICVNVCTLNQEKNIVNVCRNFLVNNRNPHYRQKYLHIEPNTSQPRLQLTEKKCDKDEEELWKRQIENHSKSWSSCGEFDEHNHVNSNLPSLFDSHRSCPCKHLEIWTTEEHVGKNDGCSLPCEFPMLNYQDSEQYPDVLKEMSQRHRHKVQRTMKKFEKLSRNIPVSSESTNSESDAGTYMERYCPCRRCVEYQEEVIKANRRPRCCHLSVYHSPTCDSSFRPTSPTPPHLPDLPRHTNPKWQQDPQNGAWYKVEMHNGRYEPNRSNCSERARFDRHCNLNRRNCMCNNCGWMHRRM